MVRLAGDDLVGAIELLEQDDPRELVGQRHRAKRQAVIGARELEPVRAADHEREVASGGSALLDEGREGKAVIGSAVAREKRDEVALAETASNALALAQVDLLEPRVAP